VLLLLLLFPGLAACGEEAPRPAVPPAPYTTVERGAEAQVVRYADGGEVRLPLAPRRIVSLLPGLTETVAMLGALDRLVGVTAHCDEPPAVRRLPQVSVLPLDAEGLAALAPDLILADATLHRGVLPELRRGFSCVLTLESGSLDALRLSVDLLAAVLGDAAAREAAADFAARLGAARAAASAEGLRSRPRVLVLAQTSPPYALGPGSLLDDLVVAAGGENVAAALGRPSGPYSDELILAARPAWILLLGAPPSAAQSALWRRRPGASDDHVVRVRGDLLLRAGPRTPAALELLSDVLRGRRSPADLERAP
jgi:iron complex transport system substrate-binding protein